MVAPFFTIAKYEKRLLKFEAVCQNSVWKLQSSAPAIFSTRYTELPWLHCDSLFDVIESSVTVMRTAWSLCWQINDEEHWN